MSQRKRVYGVERKGALVRRMLNGESVSALHQETGVPRRNLYDWREAYCREGVKGLRGPGQPRKGQGPPRGDSPEEVASRRIVDLERKIGQQALEIDFLQRAFKRVKESRQSNGGTGATASMGRSAR